ncbi:MAG TPA: sialidase family protein [Streptosporangiaceae bacterium]
MPALSVRPHLARLALAAAASLTVVGLSAATASALPAHPSGGAAVTTPTRLSADPYTNTAAEHATEVEPDIYSHGNTLVAVFQTGRFASGGSDDTGWATSTNGGSTWQKGFMPGITTHQGGGVWSRVSDPAVAFDPKAGLWLASGLTLNGPNGPFGVTVSRSANGLTWKKPVTVAKTTGGAGFDKDWITCDTIPASPHYGNCYDEWDITSSGDQVVMSTSTNGGATWSAPQSPADTPHGLGGQPLVQPGGTVVVPFLDDNGTIRSFTSTNGGSSWNASVLVANPQVATDPGGIRSSDLPQAEEDGAGKVYVAWEDCRFRSGCSSNDIVYSGSGNGASWSAVTRVPIDPVTSGVDHFLPGFGVNPATSGATAHIGLYYYFYPNSSCTVSTCQLKVGYISSANAGSSWSTPVTLAGPMKLSRQAQAGGAFVGDYLGSAFVSGKAYSSFAVGVKPASGKKFDQGMYTAGGLTADGGEVKAAAGPVHQATARHKVIPVTRF